MEDLPAHGVGLHVFYAETLEKNSRLQPSHMSPAASGERQDGGGRSCLLGRDWEFFNSARSRALTLKDGERQPLPGGLALDALRMVGRSSAPQVENKTEGVVPTEGGVTQVGHGS